METEKNSIKMSEGSQLHLPSEINGLLKKNTSMPFLKLCVFVFKSEDFITMERHERVQVTLLLISCN